jgi:hypothetical protein
MQTLTEDDRETKRTSHRNIQLDPLYTVGIFVISFQSIWERAFLFCIIEFLLYFSPPSFVRLKIQQNPDTHTRLPLSQNSIVCLRLRYLGEGRGCYSFVQRISVCVYRSSRGDIPQ